MALLLSLLHWLVPTVQAVTLENAGSWTTFGRPNPGIQTMWMKICTILPFCSVGAAAPAFFALKIIQFVFYAIGVVAVGMLIYAGIKLIISQGSDEALTEAKKITSYALGGIVLAIIGQGFVLYLYTVALPQVLQ